MQSERVLPARHGRRRTAPRGRIMTACARCQKRKIRCDGVTPVCGGCQRAHVDCVGGVSIRDISRNYVDELEARIEWLESIIREHLPYIDLHKPDEPEGSVPLVRRRGSVCRGSNPSSAPDAFTPQIGNDKDDWDPARDITDQLGLVSINAEADLRYLGPSSGLFFTRFVLTGLGRRAGLAQESVPLTGGTNFIPVELLDIQPKGLPSDFRQAQWLTQAYFQAVHGQFPFLHRPSHLDLLQKAYNGIELLLPIDQFQIYMVLAIGATIRSQQLKILLSAEGYCASAIVRLDTIFQKSSVRGVQCMLLLQMYTFHNPSSTISLWTLHYHCLAHVLELGLHRNVRGSAFTEFDQEMRTRVFWCVYTMDRYLCTSLGRAIGIMDEQCDLRLPHDISDEDLQPDQPIPNQSSTPGITDMSSAIHLFKLARFNAEIKCVLYCIDRNYPPYTQPTITDPNHWQQDILRRLRQWKAAIPQHHPQSPSHYLNSLLEIRYHELVMLVLRPSPLFPYPSKTLIKLCFDAALKCTRLYRRLYITSMLHYNRTIVQSLFLCTITIFYCIWAPNGLEEEEPTLDTVLHALKSASDILSATGEYWLEVKRTRDVLDCITKATVRRFARRLGHLSALLPSGSSGTLHNNISGQGVSIMDLRTTTLNEGSCTDGTTGNGNAGPVSVDPYYVPAQQPDATPELLSFFMDPQPESAMELLDFSWDVFGGVDDAMQEMMAGASGE
ncbi:Zn(II)2Cys6 transcription factor [Aspergillus eucalypticola CBS 122712]|uniref:Zn(II)2Cys6 transcription factor n=1 Tax=Aspergillus eucalypticola (strain CBS 122712 / IBT 29274) TaxID=1448314 RepID=A0A317W9F7_ASPEC|nr:Zn(II)2Cys6 transcription factor [Aspergillus eucalypticola CBS 122712]PWY82381.1 Zn(II)2Cys6 transcription factor [Aspergillus eucalypticola CBS 122712]